MSIESQRLPADCRLAGDILARLGDKWTIQLLMVLGDRRMRFTELHRTIRGISQRMLTVTLRNLEQRTPDVRKMPTAAIRTRQRTFIAAFLL
jgi:DNA-binding HxlR family transcriptional regulator